MLRLAFVKTTVTWRALTHSTEYVLIDLLDTSSEVTSSFQRTLRGGKSYAWRVVLTRFACVMLRFVSSLVRTCTQCNGELFSFKTKQLATSPWVQHPEQQKRHIHLHVRPNNNQT